MLSSGQMPMISGRNVLPLRLMRGHLPPSFANILIWSCNQAGPSLDLNESFCFSLYINSLHSLISVFFSLFHLYSLLLLVVLILFPSLTFTYMISCNTFYHFPPAHPAYTLSCSTPLMHYNRTRMYFVTRVYFTFDNTSKNKYEVMICTNIPDRRCPTLKLN